MKHPRQAGILWAVSPPTIRGLGRAFFSFRVEQAAALPDGPYVIAANHYSHFDSPVISAALTRPVRYLALENLFGVSRLLDWLITGYGSIPTPRDRTPIRAVRIALDALDNGEVVGVFPEATRVSHWGTLEPKRGAAWLAKRSDVPVVPIAVIGTGKAFGLENKVRRAPIQVVIGPPIDPYGLDVNTITKEWARWMDHQISRFPGSEVEGPRRSGYDV